MQYCCDIEVSVEVNHVVMQVVKTRSGLGIFEGHGVKKFEGSQLYAVGQQRPESQDIFIPQWAFFCHICVTRRAA